ncbi:MAG: GntR family transcriptional regulator [Halanaerobiales bacterium]
MSSRKEDDDKNKGIYYKKVRDEIKAKIVESTYKPGDKIPSERELCDTYNVSRTTVRKAINDLCNEGILKKYQGKGTFVEKNYNNKNNKFKNILFLRCVHSNLEKSDSKIKKDVFYPEILHGVEKLSSLKNYNCIVKTINENDPDLANLNNLKDNINGIIGCELHNPGFFKFLKDMSVPLVLISSSLETDSVDQVQIDNFSGAYKAVKYLIDLGYKNIVHIAGPEDSLPAKQRKRGYLNAIKEKDSLKKIMLTTEWNYEDGYNAVQKLIREKTNFDAIFAASDILAIGALNACKDQNIDIPDDVSIIGFDGIKLADQIRPSLSTLKVRRKEMGEVSMNLLFQLMAGERDYPLKVTVPSLLQKRETTKS